MAEAATLEVVSTSTQVSELTTYYAKWAAGTGLIPVPIVDLAAVTAVQLKMLRRLAKIHGVDYDDSSGKCLIGALLGRGMSGFDAASRGVWAHGAAADWLVSRSGKEGLQPLELADALPRFVGGERTAE